MDMKSEEAGTVVYADDGQTSQAKELNIAVTLSTGHQGSAVIKSMLKWSADKVTFNITGLARNPSSPKCQDLLSLASSSKHSLKFVECNVHNKQELVEVFTKNNIYGVYCVTFATFDASFMEEVKDGKACIDAAIESKVSYFIFSSVLSGDKIPNDHDAEHLVTKKQIEQHLQKQCEENTNVFPDGWTILRTVFYYENFLTFFPPKNGCVNVPVLRPDLKIAMASVDNIGDIATLHFAQEIDAENTGHSYDVIADFVSGSDVATILSKASGQRMRFDNGAKLMTVLSKCGIHFATDLLAMFAWFNTGATAKGNNEQCYRDLGDKRITFENFAEKTFKDAKIGRSVTRMIIKYTLLVLVVGAIIFGICYAALN